MTEYTIIATCTHCFKQRKTIVRDISKIYGKSRLCFYCNKNFTLNKDNVIIK